MISAISVGFFQLCSLCSYSPEVLDNCCLYPLAVGYCEMYFLLLTLVPCYDTIKGLLAWLVITDCSFKHGTKVKGLSVRETTNGHQHLSASDMSALSEYGDVQEKGEDKSDEQDTVLIRTLERALSGTERAAAAKLESASGDC